MAAGDMFCVFSADNTAVSYQPAAGVDVIVFNSGALPVGTVYFNITDGTDTVRVRTDQSMGRVACNNSYYPTCVAAGAGLHTYISGMQTK